MSSQQTVSVVRRCLFYQHGAKSNSLQQSQDGRYSSLSGPHRSHNRVFRPPTIDEQGKSQLSTPGALRPATPHRSPRASGDNVAMQELTGEIGKYRELLMPLERKLEKAKDRAKSAEAEAASWKGKYEAASTARDDLQSELDNERQKNWALGYELQDAREESKILLGYLENSIHANFQGAPGDSDDGWNNSGDGSWLPARAYEARRTRLLERRRTLRQQGQDHGGSDATGTDESKGKVSGTRTGAARAKAADGRGKLPAQSSWDTGDGAREAHSRKASRNDWEKGKPRR